MPNGTLVAFHAHPDDEALLDAGTLARAAQAGIRVVLVLATRGDAGDVGDNVLAADEGLAQRRSAEAEASAAAIGADRVVFLAEGRIVESGTPEQVFERPEQERTRDFLARLHH